MLFSKEQELKKHRCCFTGHRPEKITFSENEVKMYLRKAIEEVISKGFVTFISGMARGVDMWAAEIVLEKGKKMLIYILYVQFHTLILKNVGKMTIRSVIITF